MSEKMKQVIGGIFILAIVVVLTLVINNDSDSSEYSTTDTASEVSEGTESVVEEPEVLEDAVSTEEEQESSDEEDLEDPALTNEDDAEDAEDAGDAGDAEDAEEEVASTTTTTTAPASTTTATPATTAAPTTTAPARVMNEWIENDTTNCDWQGTGGCGYYYSGDESWDKIGPIGSSGSTLPNTWGSVGDFAYNEYGSCDYNGAGGCGWYFTATSSPRTFSMGAPFDFGSASLNAATNVQATTNSNGVSVDVSWSAPTSTGLPIETYFVSWTDADDGGFWGESVDASQTSLNVSNWQFKFGHTYVFKVRTDNDTRGIYSDWSSTSSAQIDTISTTTTSFNFDSGAWFDESSTVDGMTVTFSTTGWNGGLRGYGDPGTSGALYWYGAVWEDDYVDVEVTGSSSCMWIKDMVIGAGAVDPGNGTLQLDGLQVQVWTNGSWEPSFIASEGISVAPLGTDYETVSSPATGYVGSCGATKWRIFYEISGEPEDEFGGAAISTWIDTVTIERESL